MSDATGTLTPARTRLPPRATQARHGCIPRMTCCTPIPARAYWKPWSATVITWSSSAAAAIAAPAAPRCWQARCTMPPCRSPLSQRRVPALLLQTGGRHPAGHQEALSPSGSRQQTKAAGLLRRLFISISMPGERAADAPPARRALQPGRGGRPMVQTQLPDPTEVLVVTYATPASRPCRGRGRGGPSSPHRPHPARSTAAAGACRSSCPLCPAAALPPG